MGKINLRKLEMEMSKTGFLLEPRCALKLQRRNWDVMNNFIFEDPEEQKHRELDILACDAPPIFDNQRCLTIYALIECKKSEYPSVTGHNSERCFERCAEQRQESIRRRYFLYVQRLNCSSCFI